MATDPSIDTYWRLRLEQCAAALSAGHFNAFIADDLRMAEDIVFNDILPQMKPATVAWGDSMTLRGTGILDRIRRDPSFDLIETFAPDVSREEIVERRRRALLVDCFFTGTNAVTETGALVNLDMVGNRVAAIQFGPRNVVLLVGRNKIVADVDDAMERIKNFAAPVNAIRHPDLKTPCMQTARCMDCKSPDRICNTWSIIERSHPAGRIHVVLINGDFGL